MTIYFCNREAIDLNAIAIMGVSVKTGATPIGYFGTGLKFSIATLLRTGHQVRLIRSGEDIVFTVSEEVIRGELFERVKMGEERLGFTTKLGRNWEPWQAYRELYCNCLDEGGVISDALPDGDWGTVFAIDGEAIAGCHRERHRIFLQSQPISKTDDCEIHAGSGMTAFYRGVKAHQHRGPALFTYNVLAPVELTEDRTVKYHHIVEVYAETAIAKSDDEDLIERAIMAPNGTFEAQMDYSSVSGKPSLAFMDAAYRLRGKAHANNGALKLWERHADVRLTYEEVDLDAYEQEMLDRAFGLLARVGVRITRRDFIVADGLGDGVYGMVRDRQILIAKRTFDMGARFLASTIYEEHLHKSEGVKDESREMQNLLFEKLFSMVERVMVMEGRAQVEVA